MRHMQSRFANLLRQCDVALHNACLGAGRHSSQSQAEARGPRMHRAVLRETRILGMLHNREVELGAETQRHPHDVVFENRLAIVSDRDRPRALQGAEVGQGYSLATESSCRDGKHVDHGPALRLPLPLHPLRRVDHGRRIGHGADRSEASGRRGSGTAAIVSL